MLRIQTICQQRFEDRRRTPRNALTHVAKLYFVTYSQPVCDCYIIEMSAQGARVETATFCRTPRLVSLRFGTGHVCRARRVWANGNQLGLEFIPSDVLSAEDLKQIAAFVPGSAGARRR